MASSVVRTAEASGQIDWHVEQRGGGPDIILVPSGEGDCASFDIVAEALARDYRVTTFDTPGFSRSRTLGEVEISIAALGRQIASLVQRLSIERATFYGCSSAGVAVLDLVTHHEQLVHRAIVHEAAIPDPRNGPLLLASLADLEDSAISAACAALFETLMNEDPAAWRALGEEYHRRLHANYPVWVRHYVTAVGRLSIEPSLLRAKPVTWTIGGLTEARFFFSNVRLAHMADIDLDLLPCKHFPQVSIPHALVDHIRTAASLN